MRRATFTAQARGEEREELPSVFGEFPAAGCERRWPVIADRSRPFGSPGPKGTAEEAERVDCREAQNDGGPAHVCWSIRWSAFARADV